MAAQNPPDGACYSAEGWKRIAPVEQRQDDLAGGDARQPILQRKIATLAQLEEGHEVALRVPEVETARVAIEAGHRLAGQMAIEHQVDRRSGAAQKLLGRGEARI